MGLLAPDDSPDDLIRALAIRERLDVDAIDIIQRNPNANSIVVSISGVIYKIAFRAPLDPAHEPALWDAGRRVGMPTPRLLGAGVVRSRNYVAYSRLRGSHEATTPGLRGAGRALATLHSSPLPRGYPRQLNSRPRRLRRFEIAFGAGPRLGLSWWRRNRHRVQLAFDDWRAADEVPNHGDYRKPNLLFVGDALTGVLDWSDGSSSSREADLGGVDARSMREILEGYREVGTTPDLDVVSGYVVARHLSLWRCGAIDDATIRLCLELAGRALSNSTIRL